MGRNEGKAEGRTQKAEVRTVHRQPAADPTERRPWALTREITHRLLPTAYCLLLLLCRSAGAEDVDLARRERIEKMSPGEKCRLEERLEWFGRLEPQQQQRLRRLHEQLRGRPELLAVMHRYHRWLMTQPSKTREDLLALEPAARIARIKKLLDDQRKGFGRRLSAEDLEGLSRWMEQYMARREARALEGMSQQQRAQFEKMPPADRRRHFSRMTWQRWQGHRSGRSPLVRDEDLPGLLASLSEQTRLRIQEKPIEAQRQIATELVRQAIRRHLASWRPADPAALEEFFTNLPESQQTRLLEMSPEQMRRELRKMYAIRFKPSEPSGRRPGHGKRPGKASPAPRGAKKEAADSKGSRR